MSVSGVQNAFKNVLFLGLFPGFFLSISDSIFQRLIFQNRCFRMEGIAQIEFSWKSFLKQFGIKFQCFLDASGTVFLVF